MGMYIIHVQSPHHVRGGAFLETPHEKIVIYVVKLKTNVFV